jgi:hypothetical protein
MYGNLTSTELKGLSGLAVSMSNGQNAYSIVDENGGFTFNLPHSDKPPIYSVASASVGFYNSGRLPRAVAVTSIVAVVPHCSSKVGNDIWVFQGRPVYVNITVSNHGDFDENVNVTLYYNITTDEIVGTQNITIPTGENLTLSFVWDTMSIPYCSNYTITAFATIPLDNNPADNSIFCGPINVRIMGDINGDGKIDGKDIALVALSFGSCGPNYLCPGSAPSPKWNLDADTNGDNKVDGKDLVLVALNFGK